MANPAITGSATIAAVMTTTQNLRPSGLMVDK